MNKKTIVTICLAALVLISGILGIVISNALNSFKPLAGGPLNRGTVSGNGGNAVSVDGWLYYIGNYYSEVTEITYKQNEYNKLPNKNFGAIHRVKLNEQARPSYNLDEDGIDENQFDAKDVQVVVPKIAGFNKSALWIFGEYLIYTSPNNTMNRIGELQVKKIDFFRVDLNGKNHKKIYTTQTDDLSRDNFTVVSPAANATYLLVNDGGRLVRVNVHNQKFGSVEEISATSQSFAFPVVTGFNAAELSSGSGNGSDVISSYNEGVMKYVYFTVARDEDDRIKTGNLLKRYDIKNGGEVETLGKASDKEYTVLKLASGRLIYAIKELSTGDTDNIIYLTTREGEIGRNEDILKFVNNPTLSEIFYLPTEATGNLKTRFIGLSDGKFYIYREENNYQLDGKNDIITGVFNILAVTPSRVYYITSSNEIRAINLDDGTYAGGTATLAALEKCVEPTAVTFFRIAGHGDRFFYIKEFTEGNNTTNIAVMVEFWNEETPQTFVLGVVDEQYLPDDDDHAGHNHG